MPLNAPFRLRSRWVLWRLWQTQLPYCHWLKSAKNYAIQLVTNFAEWQKSGWCDNGIRYTSIPSFSLGWRHTSVVVGTRQQLNKLSVNELQLLDARVSFSESVINLGVTIDSQLSMSDHVASLSSRYTNFLIIIIIILAKHIVSVNCQHAFLYWNSFSSQTQILATPVAISLA